MPSLPRTGYAEQCAAARPRAASPHHGGICVIPYRAPTRLRVQVRSGVHGTSVSGRDDQDEIGLCPEQPQFVTRLARVPNGTGGRRPAGAVRAVRAAHGRGQGWRPDQPPGAGDLDVVTTSARRAAHCPRRKQTSAQNWGAQIGSLCMPTSTGSACE